MTQRRDLTLLGHTVAVPIKQEEDEIEEEIMKRRRRMSGERRREWRVEGPGLWEDSQSTNEWTLEKDIKIEDAESQGNNSMESEFQGECSGKKVERNEKKGHRDKKKSDKRSKKSKKMSIKGVKQQASGMESFTVGLLSAGRGQAKLTPGHLTPSLLEEVLNEKKQALLRTPGVMATLQHLQADLVRHPADNASTSIATRGMSMETAPSPPQNTTPQPHNTLPLREHSKPRPSSNIWSKEGSAFTSVTSSNT